MDKLHIGIYGAVNSGKSSLINKLAGQDIAIVSPVKGTTTDPVKKLIELDGIGPVVLIDTAGINDTTELAQSRIAKTLQSVDIIDLGIIVINNKLEPEDEDLIKKLQNLNKPFFIVNSKRDLAGYAPFSYNDIDVLPFSHNDNGVKPLLELIKKYAPKFSKNVLLDDIIKPGEVIVLVIPIDSAAPKDRIILPQVNAIRNILDNNAIAVCLQTAELDAYLKSGAKVRLVVTDSQAFKEVSQIVPHNIPLTSFSILFSRLKGNLDTALEGAAKISSLKKGDKVLILESCSHSAITCEDIGRVKLPALIRKKSGVEDLRFTIIANLEQLPQDLESYALAVQCGGCMVTASQLATRLNKVKAVNVPVSNYGVAIAYCTGILDRVTEVFRKK